MIHSHVNTRKTECRSMNPMESKKNQHPEESLVFCSVCFIVLPQTSNLQWIIDINPTLIPVYLLSDRNSALAEVRKAYLHLCNFPFSRQRENIYIKNTSVILVISLSRQGYIKSGCKLRVMGTQM